MAKPLVKNERRRAQRVKEPLQVKYRLKNRHSWKSTTCRDISGVGIRINLPQPIEAGDIIEISLPIQDNTRSLKATYRAIWYAKSSSSGYEVGLELMEPEDLPGFIKFMCNLLINACLSLEDPAL